MTIDRFRQDHARWDALPQGEKDRQIAARKLKKDIQAYLARGGPLKWWEWMRSQGPDAVLDPRLKKGKVVE